MILCKAAHTPSRVTSRETFSKVPQLHARGGHRSWHEHLHISNLLLDRLKHKCALKVSVGRESGRASLAQKVPDCTCCPELQSSRGSAQEESASRFPSRGLEGLTAPGSRVLSTGLLPRVHHRTAPLHTQTAFPTWQKLYPRRLRYFSLSFLSSPRQEDFYLWFAGCLFPRDNTFYTEL